MEIKLLYVMNVVSRLHVSNVWLCISSPYMKVRNIPVTHVTIKQLNEDASLNINSQTWKQEVSLWLLWVSGKSKRTASYP